MKLLTDAVQADPTCPQHIGTAARCVERRLDVDREWRAGDITYSPCGVCADTRCLTRFGGRSLGDGGLLPEERPAGPRALALANVLRFQPQNKDPCVPWIAQVRQGVADASGRSTNANN